MIINGCEISLILKSKNALATTVCSIVSLFWRIRKSGESWISFPWRYHRTCRGGLPRTLHSRTTTWPSDAWASCRSCTQEGMISQNIMEKIRERSWEKGASNRWQVQKKEKDGMAVAYMQTAKWMNNKSLFSQDFHFSKPGVPFNWLHLVPSFCASGNQIMYLNLAVYSIYFIFSLKWASVSFQIAVTKCRDLKRA